MNEHEVTWTYDYNSDPFHAEDGRVWDRHTRKILNITSPEEILRRHIVCGDAVLWGSAFSGGIESFSGFNVSLSSHFSIPLPQAISGDGGLIPRACDGNKGVAEWVHQTYEFDLVVFDLSTRAFRILDLPGNQSHPDIWDDGIVWLDDRHYRNDSLDVYYMNLTTGEQRLLTNDSSQVFPPRIWGPYVVWTDLRYRDPESPPN